MFFAKIICTLLLIQSFQSSFAQYYDDLAPNEPRFEARRFASLGGTQDSKTNPSPARSVQNDDNNEDDFDENDNSGSLSSVNVVPSGTKGQSASSSGKLGLPRFPSKPANTFVAPLPAPPRPVAISTPVTVVGKTNVGSSGSLSQDRSFLPLRSNEGTKTVRVVKTARVVRPQPVAVDQSEASLSGGVKTTQVRPSVTRVVRPVLVQQRQTFTPVQPVAPAPVPVSIATPITSGSAGPSQIVSGGVKTVQVSGNSKLQPPRLQVVSNQRPVAVDEDDEDDSGFASAGPSRGQVSGVKTTVTNQFSNSINAPSGNRFTVNPVRPLVQPARQPAQVIYADQKLTNNFAYDEDEFNVEIPQPDLFRTRPAQVSVQVAPQPYLVPLPARSFRPESSSDVSPAVSSGKVNAVKSTFVSRPQPVRQTVLTPVAPTPVRPNPTPVFVSSGSASGSQSAIKGSVVQSRFVPRIPTTQRPTTTVSFVDEDEEDSAAGAGNPSGGRPVLIQTTGPAPVRPVVQTVQTVQTNVQEKINIGSKSVDSVRPVVRFNPQPRPAPQPIVQIRDSGSLPAEIDLPAPPRPVQIVQRVRATPAPTIRPVTQVTQVRESAVSNFQTIQQTSQPRLVPVAPAPQPQIRVFEQARPLTQVSQVSQFEDSGLTVFQPLDPSLRPSIPQPTVQVSQVRESVAPREVVFRQPVQQQVQVSQVSQVSQVRPVQPSVETVQIRETAVPITSQGNLGVQQISQPVEVIQPAPQPVEILRLREPTFPRFEQARPQPVVQVRPRLVPVALPERRQVVQISQEKEASLAKPAVPAQVNVIQQQRPTVVVSQPQPAQVNIVQQQKQTQEFFTDDRRSNVAPVAPFVNIESFRTSQPRPVARQPVVPRLVAPTPLRPISQVTSDSLSGFSGNTQNRFETVQISQPAPVVTVQQQRPTVVVSRPQPAQVIVSNRQPVTTVQVQDNSQSAEVVQIRDNAASIPDDFAQFQQVKLARA